MKESEAEERFIEQFGVVNAIRLIGYAWQLDVRGEDWLTEHVSRQQLAKIRASYEAAGVPWAPGAIEWIGAFKRLLKINDRAKAQAAAARERAEQVKRRAGGGLRPA